MYTSQSVSQAQSISRSLTKQHQIKFSGLVGHYITPCEASVKQLEQHYATVLDTEAVSWGSSGFSCSGRKLFQVTFVNPERGGVSELGQWGHGWDCIAIARMD